MPIRLDYDYIESHVPDGARVLDLGCGDGKLLEDLIREKGVEGRGIEIDEASVRKCIKRGVPVYHGDMLQGMKMFQERHFDCVVLSQTLQQTLNPAEVMHEMLRVGKRAIVSFPNFGHWQVRARLLLGGMAPITPLWPYEWYNTPNVRMLTIKDFTRFCRKQNLRIVRRRFFSRTFIRTPAAGANFFASIAIFILER